MGPLELRFQWVSRRRVEAAIPVDLPLLSPWDAAKPVPSSGVKIAVKTLFNQHNTLQLTSISKQQGPPLSFKARFNEVAHDNADYTGYRS